MNKRELVAHIIGECKLPSRQFGEAFAPTNIALCKYWGKRMEELNLPVTNSLSISLGNKGTHTRIECNTVGQDNVYLNQQEVASNTQFYHRIVSFLDAV